MYKNNKYTPILAFLITGILVCIVCIINNIFPFGENSIFRLDLAAQYGSFLSYLSDTIQNGESLWYTALLGNGQNFIGNIINYLLSPLNIIAIIMGGENIQLSVLIIIAIKISLASLTFSYFTEKTMKLPMWENISFSIMYGLSTYVVAFFTNIMWMDAVYMLPILTLSIYLLINENKIVPYVLSLSYIIITNYYMGYMLCIASVIFFVSLLIIKFGKNDIMKETNQDTKRFVLNKIMIRKILRFGFASLIAGGISAIVLIPMLSCLSWTSVSGNSAPQFAMSFGPLEFIANHLSGTTIVERNSTLEEMFLPNIACGMLAILSTILYFCNSKIDKKEKKVSASILFLFFFSFSITFLDIVWHGFKTPNDLPYRYSFIYIFILLVMAMRGVKNIDGVSKNTIGIFSIILAISTIPLYFFCAVNKSVLIIPLSFICTILYGVFLYGKRIEKLPKIAPILLVACVCIEMALPFAYKLETTPLSQRVEYLQDVEDAKRIINEFDEDGYYRMELLETSVRNSQMIYGYNGVYSFSSVNYAGLAQFYRNIGLHSNNANITGYTTPTTISTNMLIGLDYLVDNSETEDVDASEWQEIGITTNGYKVYASKYQVGLGYAVNKFPNSIINKDKNPTQNIDNLYKSMFSLNNVLTKVDVVCYNSSGIELLEMSNDIKTEYQYTYDVKDVEKVKITITATIQEDGFYYGFLHMLGFDVQYEASNGYKGTLSPSDYTNCIGELKSGDVVTITATPSEAMLKYPLTFTEGLFSSIIVKTDKEAICNVYQQIKNNGILFIEEYGNDYIQATINNNSEFIYTTIPYDTYWDVYVDGELLNQNQIINIENAFIGLQIPKGTHTITFKYQQKQPLLIGSSISIVSTIVFCVWCIVEKKQRNKER